MLHVQNSLGAIYLVLCTLWPMFRPSPSPMYAHESVQSTPLFAQVIFQISHPLLDFTRFSQFPHIDLTHNFVRLTFKQPISIFLPQTLNTSNCTSPYKTFSLMLASTRWLFNFHNRWRSLATQKQKKITLMNYYGESYEGCKVQLKNCQRNNIQYKQQ